MEAQRKKDKAADNEERLRIAREQKEAMDLQDKDKLAESIKYTEQRIELKEEQARKIHLHISRSNPTHDPFVSTHVQLTICVRILLTCVCARVCVCVCV